MKSPDASIFGKAVLVSSHLILTYSAEGTGVNLQLYPQQVTVQEISGPDENIDLDSRNAARLMYDLDRFTEKTLPVGAFKRQLWIEELVRMANQRELSVVPHAIYDQRAMFVAKNRKVDAGALHSALHGLADDTGR